MNLHTGFHERHAFILLLVVVVAGITATGATAAAYDAECVYYETSYKQEVAVIDVNGESRCVPAAEAAAIAEAAEWPNFDPTDMTQEIAQYEAQQEAAAWPNFDPTDMTREIAQYEAQQEAAAWPNFDPTDMTREIAQYEARQEAQQEAVAWPNYNPTAIDTSTTTSIVANSPRMIQIAVQ